MRTSILKHSLRSSPSPACLKIERMCAYCGALVSEHGKLPQIPGTQIAHGIFRFPSVYKRVQPRSAAFNLNAPGVLLRSALPGPFDLLRTEGQIVLAVKLEIDALMLQGPYNGCGMVTAGRLSEDSPGQFSRAVGGIFPVKLLTRAFQDLSFPQAGSVALQLRRACPKSAACPGHQHPQAAAHGQHAAPEGARAGHRHTAPAGECRPALCRSR